MVSSIQISEDLREILKKRKLNSNESYEDVIWDLLEDVMELSKETKDAIKEAEEDFRKGRTLSQEEIRMELNI